MEAPLFRRSEMIPQAIRRCCRTASSIISGQPVPNKKEILRMRFCNGDVMAKINDEMRSIMKKMRFVSVATASKDGTPNVVPIGMVIPQPDDETIWIVDNYMKKSIANLKENPKISFFVWDPESPNSYQIKGVATVENSGSDYEKAVKCAHEKRETLPAKNLIKMKVAEIYFVTPGPKAGQKL